MQIWKFVDIITVKKLGHFFKKKKNKEIENFTAK